MNELGARWIPAAMVLLVPIVIAIVALDRRRQRLRRFLDSTHDILDGPRREAIDLPTHAEAMGTYEGRPARIRLEFFDGRLAKLSVGVDCRAHGTFSVARRDAGELDPHAACVSSARALLERHRAVSVSLDAAQTRIPPGQPRLEVVLDVSRQPDLDPGRIRAVVRDASALAAIYEA